MFEFGNPRRRSKGRGWSAILVLVVAALICTATMTVGPAAEATVQSAATAEARRLVTWDQDTGGWSVQNADGSVMTTEWGQAGDVPLLGDVDGDGFDDYVVWRPSNGKWYGMSNTGEVVLDYRWGTQGDIPLLGDVDGDGYDDMVVWRPSNGRWYARSSKTFKTVLNRPHGGGWLNDVPLLGDLDGDGRDDIIIWRPRTGKNDIGRFYAKNLEGQSIFNRSWGAGRLGDIPLIGDIDGNGADEVVIFRPSTGRWYPKSIDGSRPVNSIRHGAAGDVPMLFDADGDGDDDPVITRHYNGKKYWYARNSAGQKLPLYGVHFGFAGADALDGLFRPGLFRSASAEPLVQAAGVVKPVQYQKNLRQRIAVNDVEIFERSCTPDFGSCDEFRRAPELMPGETGAIRGMSTFVINGDELVEIVVRGDNIYRRTSTVGSTPPAWGPPTGTVSADLAQGGLGVPNVLTWLTTVAVHNKTDDQLLAQAYGTSFGLGPGNELHSAFWRQSPNHDLPPITDHGKANWDGPGDIPTIIDDGVDPDDGSIHHGYRNLVQDQKLTTSARIISANWGPNEGSGIHHQATWFEEGEGEAKVTKGFYRGTKWSNSLYGGWDPVTKWIGPIYLTVDDFEKERTDPEAPVPETIDSIVPIDVVSLQAQASYLIPLHKFDESEGRAKLVVMGDSYASGEGIVVGNETFCHRDSGAYGPMLATELNMEIQFLACSGALVKEQVDAMLLRPEQEDQLALLDADADIVTISLGGNDMLFADYLTCAVLNSPCAVGDWEQRMTAALTELRGESGWKALYEKVYQIAPSAKIFAIGYPKVLEAGKVSNAANATCPGHVAISGAEAEFADARTAELNAALEAIVNEMAAAGRQIEFVNPTAAFDGHGACASTDRWIQNLEWDGGLMPDEASFHPTARGHEAYFAAVDAAVADG